jgi:hypothetical protein
MHDQMAVRHERGHVVEPGNAGERHERGRESGGSGGIDAESRIAAAGRFLDEVADRVVHGVVNRRQDVGEVELVAGAEALDIGARRCVVDFNRIGSAASGHVVGAAHSNHDIFPAACKEIRRARSMPDHRIVARDAVERVAVAERGHCIAVPAAVDGLRIADGRLVQRAGQIDSCAGGVIEGDLGQAAKSKPGGVIQGSSDHGKLIGRRIMDHEIAGTVVPHRHGAGVNTVEGDCA